MRWIFEFGDVAYCHVPKELRSSLDAKAWTGIVIGTSNKSKGWKVYIPSLRTIKVVRHCVLVHVNTQEEREQDQLGC